MKTIWIINQYTSTPETGIRNRHYYLARELVRQGHKVYLVAASYTHLFLKPPKVDQSYQIQLIEGINIVWVKMPNYDNAHSKKRIINWFLFAWKLRGLVNVIADKPDAILYSSPSLIGFLGCKYIKNAYLNTHLVFEVRDIWPLTMIELGGYSPKNPFIRFLQLIEDKAYRDSDKVVSNLKNAVEHMVSRGMDKTKFSWIPNGFSLDEIRLKQDLIDSVIMQLPTGKFIVGYTGTLGLANALDSFIEAAVKLKNQIEIAFVLVGDGKEKSRLKNLVKEKELSNVYFIEPVAKAQVQSMLAMFDVCFIGWENNPLYKFGISANKIAEYFIAEKPIVHSYSGYCDPIKEAKAGITVPAKKPDLIADAILKLYNLSQAERDAMGNNGKCYALENYEYGKLAKKLTEVLIG